jgi:hypothetical protein
LNVLLKTTIYPAIPALQSELPTSREIWRRRGDGLNTGYAFEHCFCNAEFAHLDAIMQENGGAFEIGTKTYRLPHENYNNHVCDILMGIRKAHKW